MMSMEGAENCGAAIAKQPLLKDFLPDTWRSLSSKASNVRLVRCPKCRGVLPELADVPIYKCGGCNATLRGKNYKQDKESNSAGATGDNTSSRNESEPDIKIRDLDISIQQSNLSTKETPQQVEPEEPHRKLSKSEAKEVSHELSPPSEITCQEKELPIEAGGEKHAANCNGDNSISRSIENDALSELKSEESKETAGHGLKCRTSRETAQTTETNAVNFTSDGAEDGSKLSGKCGDVSNCLAPKDEHASDNKFPSSDCLGEKVIEQHLSESNRSILESQIEEESISKEGQEARQVLSADDNKNVNIEDENQPAKLLSKPVAGENDAGFVGDAPPAPLSRDVERLQNLNSNDSKRFHQVPYFKWLEKDKPLLKEGHFNRRRKSADNELQTSSRNAKLDERSQLELLKKLDELRDHLNKSYAHQRMAKENIAARYAQQEQRLLDGENSRHCNSCYHQQLHPKVYKLRKSMTYRGGGCSHAFQSQLDSNCMYRVDNPHSHGFHEYCKCLQKMEPANICYESGLHQTCTGYKWYDPYDGSITSSPCRPQHSNCPCRGCDQAQPRHHGLKNFDSEAAKLHLNERRQALKQHCRPMAGGAPFITCYHCSQLLKIPEEFLHTGQRSHTLRCGSCSNVLEFSLHKRIHIVPHSPKSVLPPLIGEVVNGTRNDSSAGNSSNGNNRILVNSISYSEEDYGLPAFKSCSTEGEPVLPSPAFPSPQINRADQMKPSSGHTALANDKMKKTATSILNSKNKHPMDFRKLVGSSSDQARLSLKAVAGHGTNSPLHRLMGYSSATDIINGTGAAMLHS